MTTALLESVQKAPAEPERRLQELDGWRAVSILSVLACHLLPLGPKRLQLNAAFGAFGMSLFFTLSGFLITSTLLHKPLVHTFLIRRLCRILPVAYLYIAICLPILGSNWQTWLAHIGFYGNYTMELVPGWTSHFWSLCVEMHFYLGIALLVLVGGPRALCLLPIGCVFVTGVRIYQGVPISINTHLRVDEILAGATLALVHTSQARSIRGFVAAVPWWVWTLALLVCSHPAFSALNYLRPYVGAALVGGSLWRASMITPLLASSPARYVANVSYALYLFHGFGRSGWFAEGGALQRYLVKRPLGIALTFTLAHLSTLYYEKWWINRGKAWSLSPAEERNVALAANS